MMAGRKRKEMPQTDLLPPPVPLRNKNHQVAATTAENSGHGSTEDNDCSTASSSDSGATFTLSERSGAESRGRGAATQSDNSSLIRRTAAVTFRQVPLQPTTPAAHANDEDALYEEALRSYTRPSGAAAAATASYGQGYVRDEISNGAAGSGTRGRGGGGGAERSENRSGANEDTRSELEGRLARMRDFLAKPELTRITSETALKGVAEQIEILVEKIAQLDRNAAAAAAAGGGAAIGAGSGGTAAPSGGGVAAVAVPPLDPRDCPLCYQTYRMRYANEQQRAANAEQAEQQEGAQAPASKRARHADVASAGSTTDRYYLLLEFEEMMRGEMDDAPLFAMMVDIYNEVIRDPLRRLGLPSVDWTFEIVAAHYDLRTGHIVDPVRDLKYSLRRMFDVREELLAEVVQPDPARPGRKLIDRKHVQSLTDINKERNKDMAILKGYMSAATSRAHKASCELAALLARGDMLRSVTTNPLLSAGATRGDGDALRTGSGANGSAASSRSILPPNVYASSGLRLSGI